MRAFAAAVDHGSCSRAGGRCDPETPAQGINGAAWTQTEGPSHAFSVGTGFSRETHPLCRSAGLTRASALVLGQACSTSRKRVLGNALLPPHHRCLVGPVSI